MFNAAIHITHKPVVKPISEYLETFIKELEVDCELVEDIFDELNSDEEIKAKLLKFYQHDDVLELGFALVKYIDKMVETPAMEYATNKQNEDKWL